MADKHGKKKPASAKGDNPARTNGKAWKKDDEGNRVGPGLRVVKEKVKTPARIKRDQEIQAHRERRRERGIERARMRKQEELERAQRAAEAAVEAAQRETRTTTRAKAVKKLTGKKDD